MSTRPRQLPHPSEGRPQLRLIRGDGSRRFTLVPTAIVLVLAVFAVTGAQAYLAEEGLRVSRLEQEIKEAEEQHRLLRAEMAERSSPARLERIAEEEGMAPAPDPTFVRRPGAVPEPGSEQHDARAVKRLLSDAP